MTPLMHAAAWSNDEAAIARDFLEAGADVTLANRDGRTALHFAAAFDAPAIARVLLAAGADPSAQPLGDSGSPSPPPLFEAFNGSVEALVAPILLAAGADPLAPTGVGFPAIAAAARDGHLDIVRPYLETHPEALAPEMIPLAAGRGDAAGVQMLLALGAPADGTVYDGQTALHAAVTPIDLYLRQDLGRRYDPATTLRALLGAGADPDALACGAVCGTALHLAAWEARLDLAEILLAGGADASLTKEHDGETLDALGLVRHRLANPDREPPYSRPPTPSELRAVIARLE